MSAVCARPAAARGYHPAPDVATQHKDVARDAGEPPLLPLAWEREAGLDSDEWLKNLVFDARTVRVTDRLIKIVDVLHQRSEQRFPAAARLVYAESSGELEKVGLGPANHSTVV